jgi:hypothetical protein
MQMKISWVLTISIFLVSMGPLLDAPAKGQSASCYISAGMEKSFIFVRELDQDGNPFVRDPGETVTIGDPEEQSSF